MGAEEVVCSFIIELAGDSEKREELIAADDGECIWIKIDHLWRGKCQIVYLLAKLGGQGEEGKCLFWSDDFAFVFGGVGGCVG